MGAPVHYQVFWAPRGSKRFARIAWFPLVCVLALGSAPAAAQLSLPQPVGFVNDFADVIPPAQEQQIDRVIQEVRAKSGGEIAVVTLPSLEGRGRDEVALQILREWGVGASTGAGDPRNNTGTVILVAIAERQSRIELGFGTNTFITAGEAGRFQDEYMLPAFREGDYGTGILLGVTAVAQEYAQQFGFELTGDIPELPSPRTSDEGPPLLLIFIIIIILFFLISSRGGKGGGKGGGGGRGGKRRRRMPIIVPVPMGGRGGFGGGGFGGGGFGGGGFGGGGFGGGGFGGFGGGMGGGGGAGRGW